METINVSKRTKTGTNANKRLRREGSLPASVYGRKSQSTPISVDAGVFSKLLSRMGINAVFNLSLENEKPVSVIVKELQRSPVSQDLVHVDFQQVSLTEEIHGEVSIRVIGSGALDNDTIILRQVDSISVKGFPQDIPDIIEINVSDLVIGDSFRIKDVQLPKGIVIEDDLETVLVSLTHSQASESDEEMEDEVKNQPVEISEDNEE